MVYGLIISILIIAYLYRLNLFLKRENIILNAKIAAITEESNFHKKTLQRIYNPSEEDLEDAFKNLHNIKDNLPKIPSELEDVGDFNFPDPIRQEQNKYYSKQFEEKKIIISK